MNLINTSIGKVRAINFEGNTYFCMRDVCLSLGYTGHSPWQWHMWKGNNKEKYYKKFNTYEQPTNENIRGARNLTYISSDGLYDYLDSPFSKNGKNIKEMKEWLRENYKVSQPSVIQDESVIQDVSDNDDSDKGVNIKVEWITPQKASEYLSKNINNNRNVSNVRVRQLGMRIVEGKWQFNHEGIAFNDSGELIDGQHRLKAIIFANKPIKMLVTRGIKKGDNGLYVMDSGMSRSANQMIDMSDIADKDLCKFAGPIMRYSRYLLVNKANASNSPEATIDFVQDNSEILAELKSIVDRTTGKNTIQKFVETALFFAMVCGEDKKKISAFIECYKANNVENAIKLGCNYKHALALRDTIKALAGMAGTGQGALANMSECKMCIYSFCNGRARKCKNKDPYPVTADMIFKLE